MAFDKEKTLKMFNEICRNTLMQTLQIEFIDVGEDFLVKMLIP